MVLESYDPKKKLVIIKELKTMIGVGLKEVGDRLDGVDCRPRSWWTARRV